MACVRLLIVIDVPFFFFHHKKHRNSIFAKNIYNLAQVSTLSESFVDRGLCTPGYNSHIDRFRKMNRLSSVLVGGAAAEVFFSDTFSDMSKWTASTWKSDSEMGTFEIKAGKWSADEEEDKALATTQDARFYGASASFEPFSNKGKTLIVQYQAKYDKDIECGGGYIKLGPKMEDATKFGDPTVYNIMFGPDKCGYNKRTHLIFSYKGKNVLKTSDLPYKQDKDGVTNLYRLVVKPDNTVKVLVDKQEIYSGELEKDWDLLPAKEINDPEDKKPADWVDEEFMDDPEDKKPEDWVEEAEIEDPDAKKPEDWDAEEDGEWEAPKKANPDYKGEWKPKRIKNPEYKGVWAPKKIANPEYEANDSLYAYDEFAFVGFDLWQVKAGSFFDNLIITDDEAEADKFAEKWEALNKVELEKKKESETTTTTPAPAEDDDGDIDADDDKDDDEI
ncbi:unnamed protein product [Amoebophrya sp. A120]|nr:unnamed protein product [Amoebophrya sp. A120]|eukprot:GSA120T00021714001.1